MRTRVYGRSNGIKDDSHGVRYQCQCADEYCENVDDEVRETPPGCPHAKSNCSCTCYDYFGRRPQLFAVAVPDSRDVSQFLFLIWKDTRPLMTLSATFVIAINSPKTYPSRSACTIASAMPFPSSAYTL
jgi:hypothetical protein